MGCLIFLVVWLVPVIWIRSARHAVRDTTGRILLGILSCASTERTRMSEIPALVDMVDSVPCPICKGSGEVATGRIIAGNQHVPPEPILTTCWLCEGDGEVAPVMLDEAFGEPSP